MNKDRLIFLGPLLVLPGLLVLWPLLEVVILSFKTQVILFDLDRWVGLSNYDYLVNEDLRFYTALGNTLYFTGVSVGLEFLLGLTFALYLRFAEGRLWIKIILLLPWAIPNVISAKLWQWMFHSEVGIINYILQSVAGMDEPVAWLSNPALALHSAILADVWKTTPFMTLLLWAGMQRIPENIIRAARIDKTPPLRFLLKVLLPQLRPVILTALVLRVLDAFRVFDVIYILTGGGPANSTETLSVYGYKTFFQALQFGYGSSIVVVQLLVMMALTLMIIQSLKQKRLRVKK